MIKTLRDFRKALDKMMEERGYGTKGHVQADTGTDDILVSSPAASDPEGEISVEAIFIPPRSGKRRG
jgi:hypothetical protein